MSKHTRRTVLLGTAGLATAALAGCVGDSGTDGDGGNDDNGDGGSGDGGSGNTGGIEDSSITHLGSDCAGPDPDTVTVFADGSTYTIEGTLPANIPCYEPELVDASVADGTLSLTVDIVETRTDDEGCVDCVGQVDYEATVEVSESTTVETVAVTHESGETHTVERSAFVDGKPTIVSSSIETTQTGSRTDEQSEGVDFETGDGTATIEGTILTSTPHYEAVLEEAAIERRVLQVTVGTKSTLGEDEVGTQELGFLDYEATVEIEHIDNIESAEIRHPNTTHGFEWDEDSAAVSGSSETRSSTAEANTSASE